MIFRICSIAALVLVFGSVDAAVTTPGNKTLARGQRLFLQCQSCHEISESKIIKSGPNLFGTYGRKVASLDGYAYSSSLKAQSFVWDEANLDRWLIQPTLLAAGTTMAYIGMPKAEDRKALIGYLKAAK